MTGSRHDEYQRDGVVVVRGLLDADGVETARRGVEAVLRSPGPLAIEASAPGDGRFVEDFCTWERIPEIASIARDPGVGRVALELMGGAHARLHHDHVLVKEAHTAQRTPWHQDQPYYDVAGRRSVSLWIALDDVPAESSLACVRGSHLGPWLMPRTFLDREARWFPEGTLDEIPDYAADDPRIVRHALAPGDAIAFHFLTVHGSAGTEQRRRALSLRYVGDDAVRAVRPWRTSPPIDVDVDDGAPLDHPRFPIVARSEL
jgi:ectoine hydroxylase-related dioxygenase (phytanoyl-CoA dioxygenase family)